MELIEIKDLTLKYDGVEVLSKLNITINSGDYLCIIGENGTGKTTLIKALLGLKKIDDGSINLLNGLTKKDIGYLPQFTFLNHDFPATVMEIVLTGFEGRKGLRPFYKKEEKEKAIQNLKMLDLLDYKNKSFMELSGGQKQRVLLARSLCATNKILVMDEPVSSLDQESINEMYNLVAKLNKEYGITIIMISHDLDNVDKQATKILKLGHDYFYGSIDKYLGGSNNE